MPLARRIRLGRETYACAALLAVLAIAAFLRFYQLTGAPPGLYHDEAINGIDCLRNLENHRLEIFYPANAGREGLYIDVATLSVYCFGNTAWALRLPAAIFGVLTVLAVYLVAAELFSRAVGLLAAFFVATSFWHVLLSRLALRAIAAPFFLTLSCYLLALGVRRALQGRQYAGVMLSAGLVYGLGFHTYIAYRVTPMLIAALFIDGFLRLHRERRVIVFWKALALFCVGLALAAGPLAIDFLHRPDAFLGRASQVSVLNSPHPAREVLRNIWRTGRMFFVHGDANWRLNYAYRAELFWPVAILFAAGIVYSLSARRFAHVLLLLWLAAGALPAVLSNEALPHALRSILLLPPACILAAVGAQWVHRLCAPRLPRALLLAAAVAMMVWLTYEPYRTYFHDWTPRAEVARAMEADATAVARKIDAMPRELPKYVAFYGAEDPDEELPSEVWDIQYLTGGSARNVHYLPFRRFRGPSGEACQAATASAPENGVVLCLEYFRGI